MRCDFCGAEIPVGTGIMYVKRDGKLFYFCSKKCMKNAVKLKRDKKLAKWSVYYQSNAKKNKKKKSRRRKR